MIYTEQIKNLTIRLRPFTVDDMGDEYITWFHSAEVTRYNSHGLFPMSKKKMEELEEKKKKEEEEKKKKKKERKRFFKKRRIKKKI